MTKAKTTVVTPVVTDFDKLLGDYSMSIKLTLARAKQALEEVYGCSDLSFGTNSRAGEQAKNLAASNIMRRYIAAVVCRKYAFLDKRIYDLRRFVEVRFSGDNEQARVVRESAKRPEHTPRSVDGEQSRWISASVICDIDPSASRGSIGWTNWPAKKDADASLYAKLPAPLPTSVQRAGNECKSLIHKAISDLYSFPAGARALSSIHWPSVRGKVIWAPQLEDLYIVKQVVPPPGDPALVICFDGMEFLAGTWDEPEDSKLSTLLEEFAPL